MNKIEFLKIRDIDRVWHWVNPQHVTEVSPFQGYVIVRLSGDSFIMCPGDGGDCFHNIQQMIDYLTGAHRSTELQLSTEEEVV